MQRALVTGAAGFIGSRLVDMLHRTGWQVVGIDDERSGEWARVDPACRRVEADLSAFSTEELAELCAGVDVVFHLAAEKHNAAKATPQKIIDVNVTATGDTVTLKVKVPSETQKPESSQWTWYLHEIPHGEFTRTIDLPVEINPQNAKATFQNGLLRLELPKVEEARQHKLQIQTGGQTQQKVNVGQSEQQMGQHQMGAGQ